MGAAATFIAALLKREITWAKFKHCFYATAEASAMIFMIFLGADLMNSALALTQVPGQLAAVVQGWGLAPLAVVLALSLPIRLPVHRAADTGAGPVDGDLLWMAVGLVLVFEGLFPLLAPRAWRAAAPPRAVTR